MAHDKVYGICESKCKVEVLSKKSAYGINKVTTDTRSVEFLYADIPDDCERMVCSGGSKVLVLHSDLSEYPIGYYSEIVFKRNNKTSGIVDDVINTNSVNVKLLNPNLDITGCNVIKLHFSHDGLATCIWCSAYAI